MRYGAMLLALACIVVPGRAQKKTDEGPTNEKAQKTYKEGLEYLQQRRTDLALGDFKKADKQEDGHCLACQQKMIKYGIELGGVEDGQLRGGGDGSASSGREERGAGALPVWRAAHS